jgi:Trk K+ transport system NAD-binding subunit
MPRGRDAVRRNDRVIVFAMPEAIPRIERLFA